MIFSGENIFGFSAVSAKYMTGEIVTSNCRGVVCLVSPLVLVGDRSVSMRSVSNWVVELSSFRCFETGGTHFKPVSCQD